MRPLCRRNANVLEGGVIIEYLSCKWVFWIFGIIAAAAITAGFFVIPLPPAQAEPSMRNTLDWVGGTLITVGLITLLFALSEGNEVGWSTPWVPVLIAVSLLIVVAFGFWQHYLETKTEKRLLMKMFIFKNRNFLWANVIMALFFSSFNNFLVYATYWFQDCQGLSVIQTTLRFIPTGVTGILVALATGYILSSVRGDYILTFSTICVSVASLLFAYRFRIIPHTGLTDSRLWSSVYAVLILYSLCLLCSWLKHFHPRTHHLPAHSSWLSDKSDGLLVLPLRLQSRLRFSRTRRAQV